MMQVKKSPVKRSPDLRDDQIFTATAPTKTYVSGEVQVHALNNVDIEIAEKEVVVLLGPSGSGKTTLLNIMGALSCGAP